MNCVIKYLMIKCTNIISIEMKYRDACRPAFTARSCLLQIMQADSAFEAEKKLMWNEKYVNLPHFILLGA